MEIIDFHCHPGYDFHLGNHGVAIDPRRFRHDLMANGITKCCGSIIDRAMCGRPVSEYEQLIPVLNNRALAMRELWGDFYVPGIHVHPAFVELSCHEIERCHAKGVRLIGELVPYMMQYNALAVPEADAIWEAAARRNMVVSIHPTTYPDIIAFANRHKTLKIVAAHISAKDFDTQVDVMKQCENVWFDVSGHADDRENFVRDAIDAVGKDRILYGSDFPGYLGDRFIRAVERDCRTEDELEAILWNNGYDLLFK